jgi:hypothetical protein
MCVAGDGWRLLAARPLPARKRVATGEFTGAVATETIHVTLPCATQAEMPTPGTLMGPAVWKAAAQPPNSGPPQLL